MCDDSTLKRRILYMPKNERLVYLDAEATPEFWDARWEAEGKPPALNQRHEVVRVTGKYLPSGARVLEGGCGRAEKVQAMADAGFSPIGVDFAEDTVRQAHMYYPGIDIRVGDVRDLDFPDEYFDGYWSFGVIEHFWSGYDDILAEAARVLRPDGLLFLTAPWFSPYRKNKARRNAYRTLDQTDEVQDFYQFALGRDEVCNSLRKHGLHPEHWRGRASEISMRDDMTKCRRQIDWLLGSRGSIAKRVLRRLVTKSLNRYCGHSFLVIARRTS